MKSSERFDRGHDKIRSQASDVKTVPCKLRVTWVMIRTRDEWVSSRAWKCDVGPVCGIDWYEERRLFQWLSSECRSGLFGRIHAVFGFMKRGCRIKLVWFLMGFFMYERFFFFTVTHTFNPSVIPTADLTRVLLTLHMSYTTITYFSATPHRLKRYQSSSQVTPSNVFYKSTKTQYNSLWTLRAKITPFSGRKTKLFNLLT